MSQIFKSGAFIQQCFAVHPLSLSFKMLSLPDKVGVLCTNCNMRHRLTVRLFKSQLGEEPLEEVGATDKLAQCTAAHPEDLRISEVSVERDSIQFRCRKCKRAYHVDVSLFESHQP